MSDSATQMIKMLMQMQGQAPGIPAMKGMDFASQAAANQSPMMKAPVTPPVPGGTVPPTDAAALPAAGGANKGGQGTLAGLLSGG